MDRLGGDPLGAAWDLARDAVLVGWLATALFCAVAGAAVAIWGALPWWAGALVGALALFVGVTLVLVVAAVRAGSRRREHRSAGPPDPLAPDLPPAPPPATGTGLRAGVRRGWRTWTRTPPTRAETTTAVLAVLVAIGAVAATQVTWVTVSAVGRQVVGGGPFAVQLGLFVVLTALAALVCAAGVLRWRSAWWPVLLAWFGAWWLFVAVEVLRAQDSLAALNRLLREQVSERVGYDARPQIALGVGWTVMIVLAVVMMVLAVVLLVLQGRRAARYRALARPA